MSRDSYIDVFYCKENNHQLVGFSDTDYAGDVEDCKSTFGFVFLFNSGAISWSSYKHPLHKHNLLQQLLALTRLYGY